MRGLSVRPSVGPIEIPVDDVEFHPFSFADPGGRLFIWEQQLYRAIAGHRAALCTKLFQDGVVEKLVKQGLLVETEPTVFTMSGYPLVLRHRLLPFVSYAHEWCAPMLRDAALLVLDLELHLSEYGLTLQDAHPCNVLFDGVRPVYVDFNSIVQKGKTPSWPVCGEEFRRFFLRPLYLMASGHGRIARWLLDSWDEGVHHSDVEELTHGPGAYVRRLKNRAAGVTSTVKKHIPLRVRQLIRKTMSSASGRHPQFSGNPRAYRILLERLRREVENIKILRVATKGSDSCGEDFTTFHPSEHWTTKHHAVHGVLGDLKPASLLDVGSNRGWYSQLAARAGARVVTIDADETCVSALFRDAKAGNLPILPLVMDFRNPSLGLGDWWGAPATRRFGCEMVMSLALIHHLVFGRRLDFHQIVGGLSTFANRWLLVEFVPFEDESVRKWAPKPVPWYTLGYFQQVLQRHYRRVRTMPSHPAPRVLLLCDK